MKISMIGCGKLGLPCAEVMADYYDVVGYDIQPFQSATVSARNTIQDAVRDRDIIFIAVPTPHAPEYDGSRECTDFEPKNFDYSIVQSVLTEVNSHVNQKQLVVLISTVLPGTVRKHLAPLLTNARFIYNPYLIAMGSVAFDMINPECLIIGTVDGDLTGDAKLLVDFYRPLMQNEPPINIGTYEEAEAIKIFYNTWISAKISLVNMIQDVAERLGNMNVDVVTDALKRATQRITGTKYMTAGMGDGGACVLPEFTVNVNNENLTIEKLYTLWSTTPGEYKIIGSDADCTNREVKEIKSVTKRDYTGKMIRLSTDSGEIIVTPNHLIPVYRSDKLIIIRADQIKITDELYIV